MHVNSSMYTLMATMEVQPEVVFPIPFWDLQLCTTVPVFGHMYGTVPCDTIIGKLTGIYLLPIHQGLIITVAKFGQPTITLNICGSDCSLFFISIREQPCTLPLRMAMLIK